MADAYHPNDTLNGRLFAYEREDEKHLRGKLGYWRMVEERMVRGEIEAEGGDPTNIFEISRRITENHKNDPTFREQQEAQRAARPVRIAVPDITFSMEELLDMREKYEGSNTEIGQGIRAKVDVLILKLELTGAPTT